MRSNDLLERPVNGVRDVAGFQDPLGLFHQIHIEIERRVLDHPQVIGMKPSDTKCIRTGPLESETSNVLDEVYDLASNPGKLCRGR